MAFGLLSRAPADRSLASTYPLGSRTGASLEMMSIISGPVNKGGSATWCARYLHSSNRVVPNEMGEVRGSAPAKLLRLCLRPNEPWRIRRSSMFEKASPRPLIARSLGLIPKTDDPLSRFARRGQRRHAQRQGVVRASLNASASESIGPDATETTMTTASARRPCRALILLTAMAIASPAAAEDPAPSLSPKASRPVRLAIDGINEGVLVRVVTRPERDSEAGKDAATCTHDCELHLPKGSYTLVATRGAEQRTKEVDLTSAQVATVGRWDHAGRTMGTVLGVTGIVVGALGAFIMVGFFAQPALSPDADEDTEAKISLLGLGLLGVAGGTGLAIGGFSMASSNRAPSLEVDRMPSSRPAPPPSTATGLSLSGKF